MAGFITLPNSTTLVTDTTTWAGVSFDNLVVIVALIAGLAIGGMVVGVIVRGLIGAAKRAIGSRGRGGRRRR